MEQKIDIENIPNKTWKLRMMRHISTFVKSDNRYQKSDYKELMPFSNNSFFQEYSSLIMTSNVLFIVFCAIAMVHFKKIENLE